MTRAARGVIAVALIALAAAGLGQARPRDVISVSGYPLEDSPQDAAGFAGNDLVFEAEVVSRGETRFVSVAAGTKSDRIEYTYTPVKVRVSGIFKGKLEIGQTVIIRSLGGATATVEYVFEDFAGLETYQTGAKLLLFTQPILDVDGLFAATPNFVYVVQDGRARSAVHPFIQMDINEFRDLISSAQIEP